MTITALSAVAVLRWFIPVRTGRYCDGYGPASKLAPIEMILVRRGSDVACGYGHLLVF